MPNPAPGDSLFPLPPPVQPKETNSLPRGEDWIYELLWNGERVRAVKDKLGVRLLSRDGRNIGNRFPRVAAAVARLRPEQAVIDGEILLLGGYSEAAVRFLARASDEIPRSDVAFLAYDLLQHCGKDMRHLPLLGRRFVLASMIQESTILVSPLCNGSSEDALAQAAQLALPGIVAKRAGSCYRPNALTTSWLKVLLGSHFPAEGRSRSRGSRPPLPVPAPGMARTLRLERRVGIIS